MLVKRASLVLLCLVLVLLAWTLSARFDSTATIHYRFETGSHSEHNLTLAIPLAEYREYKERPRPVYEDGLNKNELANKVLIEYRSMAVDPGNDYLIDVIASDLNEMAIADELDCRDRAGLALRFVQSLTYARDIDMAPYGEYPRYPVETLFDQGGDCEDTSILLAAILLKMDYDVALLFFDELDHMGLGIYFPEEAGIKMYGNSWIHDDNGDGYGGEDERRYWYLDTSGGHSIGWCPDEYMPTSAYVFPVGAYGIGD